MIPSIVVSYVDRRKGKVAKAAFVNVGDALIFWEALDDVRKRYLVMETLEGERVTEIAHTGYVSPPYGGYYGHAAALTKGRPLPPREHDRERAKKVGWEFVTIENDAEVEP